MVLSRKMNKTAGAVLLASTSSMAQQTGLFKVIELLGAKQQETKKVMHEDDVVATAYAQWCTGEKANLEREIEELDEKVDKYGARSESEAAKQKTFAEEAMELRAEVTSNQKELADITAVREKEAAEAKATIQDYAESLDAIDRAILTMQSKVTSIPATALLQMEEAATQLLRGKMSKKPVDVLTSFLSTVEKVDLEQEPGVAYEQGKAFKDVIRLLQQLEDKFQSEKNAAETAEQNAIHAYTQQRMDLTHMIETDTNEAERKEEASAKAGQESAQAAADRDGAAEDLKSTKKSLADTTKTCHAKAELAERRAKAMQEELDAISQCVEALDAIKNKALLQLGNASGVKKAVAAKKTVKSLLQVLSTKKSRASPIIGNKMADAVASYLTSTSPAETASGDVNQQRLRKMQMFLQSQAGKLGSRLLAQLEARTEAKDSPFDKVLKLIQGLIARLESEASEEQTHKAWCDSELAKNKALREERSAKVDGHKSLIEAVSADVESRTAENKELAAQITEQTAQVATLQADRVEEKKVFDEAVKDAKEVMDAVEYAIQIMESFNMKGVALLQASTFVKTNKQAPAALDDEYVGGFGSIVAMLEVIGEDTEKQTAERKRDEAAAIEEHNKTLTDLKSAIAVAKQNVKHNKSTIQSQESRKQAEKEDLQMETELLNQAMKEYEESLKPSCVNASSYEDRVEKRQQEIESLQEALKILEGQ
ncbi:unnamed protein product [Amoebophrya sp. A25]|nr:unnamed protein product [Amoebophrya sp. A25]|eukprot:GSA25T00005923001.1